jgi:hypothetical protein
MSGCGVFENPATRSAAFGGTCAVDLLPDPPRLSILRGENMGRPRRCGRATCGIRVSGRSGPHQRRAAARRNIRSSPKAGPRNICPLRSSRIDRAGVPSVTPIARLAEREVTMASVSMKACGDADRVSLCLPVIARRHHPSRCGGRLDQPVELEGHRERQLRATRSTAVS